MEKLMVDLDTAVNDLIAAIAALPAEIRTAVQDSVAAANSNDSAALTAALRHQQDIADTLEKATTDINQAVSVSDPGPPSTPTPALPPGLSITDPTLTGGALPETPAPITIGDAIGQPVSDEVPAEPTSTLPEVDPNAPQVEPTVPSDTPIGDGITPSIP